MLARFLDAVRWLFPKVVAPLNALFPGVMGLAERSLSKPPVSEMLEPSKGDFNTAISVVRLLPELSLFAEETGAVNRGARRAIGPKDLVDPLPPLDPELSDSPEEKAEPDDVSEPEDDPPDPDPGPVAGPLPEGAVPWGLLELPTT